MVIIRSESAQPGVLGAREDAAAADPRANTPLSCSRLTWQLPAFRRYALSALRCMSASCGHSGCADI
jgi:hypothetical protein